MYYNRICVTSFDNNGKISKAREVYVKLAIKELPCTRTARCDQLHDKVLVHSENRKSASNILCSEHNKKC